MKYLIFIFSLFLLVSVQAAERTVVSHGKSDYVIVYNDKVTGVPKYAANDLQLYIRKATGAKLPIVKASQRNGRKAFLIGFDKVAIPEGFMVRTDGNDIRISGNDSTGNIENNHWASGARTGTWYGVCDFLEKQLPLPHGIHCVFEPGTENIPLHSGSDVEKSWMPCYIIRTENENTGGFHERRYSQNDPAAETGGDDAEKSVSKPHHLAACAESAGSDRSLYYFTENHSA